VLLTHARTDDGLLGREQNAQEQPPARLSFLGGLGVLCTTACSLRAVVGATAGDGRRDLIALLGGTCC